MQPEPQRYRVLVVDDSAYNRQTIAAMLESEPGIEVVGRASDGEDALKQTANLRPDLITLDLEMPKMDGFTFLRILMSKLPTPVIVISTHSRKQSVFQALELGALDFLAKPTRHISPDLHTIKDELVQKVLTLQRLRIGNLQHSAEAARAAQPATSQVPPAVPDTAVTTDTPVVALGASTGGPAALQAICSAMTTGLRFAIVVSQHMPAKFTGAFAERLNRHSAFRVGEALDGELMHVGHVYIAPGGQHLTFAHGEHGVHVKLLTPTKTDKYVPSVDTMFASAARTFGQRLTAMVLTGMGSDGRQGAIDVKAAGGKTLAESEDTAVIFGMPAEAIGGGGIDRVMPLPALIGLIREIGMAPR